MGYYTLLVPITIAICCSAQRRGADPVVFPPEDPNQPRNRDRLPPGYPQGDRKFGNPEVNCSNTSTYCEDVPNYPAKEIGEAIRSNNTLLTYMKEFERRIGIGERQKLDEKSEYEVDACSTVTKVVYPKTMKNTLNQWKFVANNDKGMPQELIVEECKNPGGSCSGVSSCSSLPTRCVQKYVTIKMMVLNENSIDPGDVLLPSSCACYITTVLSRRQPN